MIRTVCSHRLPKTNHNQQCLQKSCSVADREADSNISTHTHTHTRARASRHVPVVHAAQHDLMCTSHFEQKAAHGQRSRGREGRPRNHGSIPDRDFFFPSPKRPDRVGGHLTSSLTLLWYHGVYVTPVLFDSRFFLKLSRILISPFTYFSVSPS